MIYEFFKWLFESGFNIFGTLAFIIFIVILIISTFKICVTHYYTEKIWYMQELTKMTIGFQAGKIDDNKDLKD